MDDEIVDEHKVDRHEKWIENGLEHQSNDERIHNLRSNKCHKRQTMDGAGASKVTDKRLNGKGQQH